MQYFDLFTLCRDVFANFFILHTGINEGENSLILKVHWASPNMDSNASKYRVKKFTKVKFWPKVGACANFWSFVGTIFGTLWLIIWQFLVHLGWWFDNFDWLLVALVDFSYCIANFWQFLGQTLTECLKISCNFDLFYPFLVNYQSILEVYGRLQLKNATNSWSKTSFLIRISQAPNFTYTFQKLDFLSHLVSQISWAALRTFLSEREMAARRTVKQFRVSRPIGPPECDKPRLLSWPSWAKSYK